MNFNNMNSSSNTNQNLSTNMGPNLSNFANDPTVNIGMKIGQEYGTQYVSVISQFLSFNFLRPYFQVNYKYVLMKIKYILLPFLYKEPELQDESDFEDNTLNIPRSKIEYPDLYIPLLSFMSYIMLVIFNAALNDSENFHPDNLYYKCIKNFGLVIFHMGVLKVCKSFLIWLIFFLIKFIYKFD